MLFSKGDVKQRTSCSQPASLGGGGRGRGGKGGVIGDRKEFGKGCMWAIWERRHVDLQRQVSPSSFFTLERCISADATTRSTYIAITSRLNKVYYCHFCHPTLATINFPTSSSYFYNRQTHKHTRARARAHTHTHTHTHTPYIPPPPPPYSPLLQWKINRELTTYVENPCWNQTCPITLFPVPVYASIASSN